MPDDSMRMPFVFGRFTLRSDPLALERDGCRIPLADGPLRMLARLLQSPGTVVTYEELARTCGGGSSRTASAALRTSMRLLRQALRDPASYPLYIETIRGYGYRFIAPVTAAGAGPLASVMTAGPSPAANLVQWVTDDNAAVEFSVIWLVGSVAACFVLSEWILLPLIAAPAAIRLGMRAAAIKGLVREGIMPAELATALTWADQSERQAAPRHGWRGGLHILSSLALALAVAQVAALLMATWTRAWEAEPRTQQLWNLALSHMGMVFGTALVLLLADAVATPRPFLGTLVASARRTWRRAAAWFLRGHPAAHSGTHPFLADAERELDAFLSEGLRQHRAT